jgi:hypothetical protein
MHSGVKFLKTVERKSSAERAKMWAKTLHWRRTWLIVNEENLVWSCLISWITTPTMLRSNSGDCHRWTRERQSETTITLSKPSSAARDTAQLRPTPQQVLAPWPPRVARCKQSSKHHCGPGSRRRSPSVEKDWIELHQHWFEPYLQTAETIEHENKWYHA